MKLRTRFKSVTAANLDNNIQRCVTFGQLFLIAKIPELKHYQYDTVYLST